jgi:hypothetical protein
MFNLFRAEWIKISGNRWVTAFLIWVFPTGALAFTAVLAVIIILTPAARDGAGVEELGLNDSQWTEQAISVWTVPNSLLGRIVLLAFTSVVFAGEYQWHTWKNIIPKNRRTRLILTKFVVVGLYVVTAFVLMSIIFALGWGVLVWLVGESYGPELTRDVLGEFVSDYARQAWLAFSLTIIAAGYAALAGMLTRSILGGVIVSIVLTYVEGLSVVFLMLIGYFVDYVEIVHLYRLTPSYNVANVRSWIMENQPEGFSTEVLGDAFDISFADGLTFSLVLLATWVVGLVGLTAYLFHKQDVI